MADGDGRVWAVARRPLDADSSSARVYDAAGRLVGVMPLPERFTLEDARADRLVGVQRDALDVETVVVYGYTPHRR